MRDPQPGALAVGKVVEEMRRASTESIAVSHEIKRELRRAGAPAASIHALTQANRGYRSFAREAKRASRTHTDGIHLQTELLALQAGEVRAVCASAGK